MNRTKDVRLRQRRLSVRLQSWKLSTPCASGHGSRSLPRASVKPGALR